MPRQDVLPEVLGTDQRAGLETQVIRQPKGTDVVHLDERLEQLVDQPPYPIDHLADHLLNTGWVALTRQ